MGIAFGVDNFAGPILFQNIIRKKSELTKYPNTTNSTNRKIFRRNVRSIRIEFVGSDYV